MERASAAKIVFMKTCLFEIGDPVKLPGRGDIWGYTTGTVVETGRAFKEVFDGTREINPDGLVQDERDIKSICLPYEFDGETLTVYYPEKEYTNFVQKAFTKTSIFYTHRITVKSAGGLSLHLQHRLKKDKSRSRV